MNENICPPPSLVRKLTQEDCGFAKTVFNSNFRRIIDTSSCLMADTYFNAKRENNVSNLTDTFWFDAHNTCHSTYNRLPMVYGFINMVNKHISDGTEGINLLDRDNPYYLKEATTSSKKTICESFNQLIDFFEEVNVLTKNAETNSFGTNRNYISYTMEGYVRFKIIK